MNKTNIMVRFSIYGESFDPTDITKLLEIKPSHTHKKGDMLKNGISTRKDTAWSIETGYEESLNINDQIERILKLLEGKKDILLRIRRDMPVEMLFMIVVKIENKETPAMYFLKDTLNFFHEIKAEVGFDLYVYD